MQPAFAFKPEKARVFLAHARLQRACRVHVGHPTGLPHCLRMSVGTEEANRKVVAALAAFLERPGAQSRSNG